MFPGGFVQNPCVKHTYFDPFNLKRHGFNDQTTTNFKKFHLKNIVNHRAQPESLARLPAAVRKMSPHSSHKAELERGVEIELTRKHSSRGFV